MKKHDLAAENVFSLVLALSLPTCLSQAVNVLYAVVDRMFIGNIPQVGDIALSGVGVAVPVTSLISSFAVLIGLGGSPLMAIREGHGEHEEAERILSTGFILLAGLSLILTPLFFLLKPPLLHLFGSSAQTFPYADEYLGWYLTGTPFALLSSGLNSFVINQGMGVKGAAIATVLSQAASFIITITCLLSPRAPIRLRLTKPRAAIIRRTVILGLSPFIIIATDSIIMIALNAVLQAYGGEGTGDQLIAASTIIQSWHLLVMNPLGGITGGSQGLLSYSYGAGRTDRVRQTWRSVQLLATLYTIIMTILAFSVSDVFISLFTQDEALISLTGRYLRIFTAMIIPLSFQYNTVDTFTTLGKSSISLPLSLFRKLCFVFFLFLVPFMTQQAGSAFLSEPASDLISACVSTTVLAVMLPRVLKEREENGLRL